MLSGRTYLACDTLERCCRSSRCCFSRTPPYISVGKTQMSFSEGSSGKTFSCAPCLQTTLQPAPRDESRASAYIFQTSPPSMRGRTSSHPGPARANLVSTYPRDHDRSLSMIPVESNIQNDRSRTARLRPRALERPLGSIHAPAPFGSFFRLHLLVVRARARTLELAKIHSSSVGFSLSITSRMALPTRPLPPVTRTIFFAIANAPGTGASRPWRWSATGVRERATRGARGARDDDRGRRRVERRERSNG